MLKEDVDSLHPGRDFNRRDFVHTAVGSGFAAAVLIRGLWPAEGVAVMRRKRGPIARGKPDWRLADGPAKLTQALALDGHWNGYDLCAPGAELCIEAEPPVNDDQIAIGPRIGLGRTPEPWLSMAWNFQLVRQ